MLKQGIGIGLAVCALGWAGCGGDSGMRDLKSGIAAFREKRYDDAVVAFEKASRRIGNSTELYYYLGCSRLLKGELDLAYAAFNSAIDVNPNHGESLAGMGEVAYFRNELPKARGLFLQAVMQQMASPESAAMAYNGLSMVYREEKKPALARLSLLNAQRCCKDYAPTYYNLAQLYGDTYHLYEEAVDQLGLYLQLADKSDAYYEKAKNHMKRFGAAAAAIPPAVPAGASRDEAAAQRLLDQAMEMQVAKRYPRAAKAFRDALNADPGNFNAAWGLGVVSAKQRLRVEARDAFKRASALRPGFLDAYVSAAEQSFQMRKYDEAEQLIAPAIARSPFYLPAVKLMGEICKGRKDTEAARMHGEFCLSLLKENDPQYAECKAWLESL